MGDDLTDVRGASPLDRLLDREAIRAVVDAYGFLLDAGEWDRFADLFCLDATYTISPDPGLFPLPVHGRDAITRSIAARHAVNVDEQLDVRHHSTNVVLHQLGEGRAAVTSFLLVVQVDRSGTVTPRRSGTYVDTLALDEGSWRFASRHLHLGAVPDLATAFPDAPAPAGPAARPA